MAEKNGFEVEYSTQALSNAIEIVAYLQRKFSQNEVDKFYLTLADFEKIISLYPKLYPVSSKRLIRRAVLSKVLSVYYTLRKHKIYVVAILDNRWDEDSKIE